jgi:hypothetical protein
MTTPTTTFKSVFQAIRQAQEAPRLSDLLPALQKALIQARASDSTLELPPNLKPHITRAPLFIYDADGVQSKNPNGGKIGITKKTAEKLHNIIEVNKLVLSDHKRGIPYHISKLTPESAEEAKQSTKIINEFLTVVFDPAYGFKPDKNTQTKESFDSEKDVGKTTTTPISALPIPRETDTNAGFIDLLPTLEKVLIQARAADSTLELPAYFKKHIREVPRSIYNYDDGVQPNPNKYKIGITNETAKRLYDILGVGKLHLLYHRQGKLKRTQKSLEEIKKDIKAINKFLTVLFDPTYGFKPIKPTTPAKPSKTLILEKTFSLPMAGQTRMHL